VKKTAKYARNLPLLALIAILGSTLFLSSLPPTHALSTIQQALDCSNLDFSTFFSGYGGSWSSETTTWWYGGSAMQSAPMYTSDPNYPSYCYITTGVTGPGLLLFNWKVDCAAYSYLSLEIGQNNGVVLASTADPNWREKMVFIPAGHHEIYWKYIQSTIYNGVDKGWLDFVRWWPTWPQLVVRGQDNRIWARSYDEQLQAFYAWDSMPGATCDSPAAAVLEPGSFYDAEMHIVVRGTDGTSLWHGIDDLVRGGLDSWAPLDGATNSAPALTSNGTVVCLVVRGLNNCIYYRVYDSIGGWGWWGWKVIPDGLTCDGPAAAMLGNNLFVVVRGIDGNTLWYTEIRITDNAVLKGWTPISGSTPSKPTLVAAQDQISPVDDTPTMLYLVVRGMQNQILYREWWPDTKYGFGNWKQLPGATCDSPGAWFWWTGFAVTPYGPYLNLVVRGLDGHTLWHGRMTWDGVTYPPDGFTGWTAIDGASPSSPTLAG
jgi:hypothetical protein